MITKHEVEMVAQFGTMPHLKLADGSVYALTAIDSHAADIVAQCSAIMQLQSADGPARVVVAVDNSMEQAQTNNTFTITLPVVSSNGVGEVLVCNLGPTFEDGTVSSSFFEEDVLQCSFFDDQAQIRRIGQISSLALGIARDILPRGGLLLHGALAEGPRGGVILSGPSHVGKSTASNRLPPPWRSLSDDATLVVCDAHGQYWAHPWPTWSRFYNDGPGGSWDVQRAVPLLGIFFLVQSLEDRVATLQSGHMISQLINATQQGGGEWMTLAQPESIVRAIYQERLVAVMALAETVPVQTLHISLSGSFWEEIERVLPVDRIAPQRTPQTKPIIVSPSHTVINTDPRPDNLGTHAVVIGSSMAPTLCEADILTIEPYREQPVRRGDVIHFLLPESDYAMVQRVTRITTEGIHTRSDNSEHTVRHCLHTAHIVGRVVAVRRDQQQRRIAGGWHGHMIGHALRLRQSVLRTSAGLWNRSYDTLARMGFLRHTVPPHLKPRILFFQRECQQWCKIKMGTRIVGHYDYHQQLWIIQQPFRLFIGEDKLPQVPHRTKHPYLTSH